MPAITFDLIKATMPYASTMRIQTFLPHLQNTCKEFGIDQSPLRVAHFLAQLTVESGSLRYVEEIASGEAYDTGRLAKALGNTPEADGDGQRYKGRGLIQITGRANYEACGKALRLPLVERPELLCQPEPACRSAGWYWEARGLNGIAEQDDVEKVTRIVNGGTNGLEGRRAALRLAKKHLGILPEGE